jgi:hypothetical protein
MAAVVCFVFSLAFHHAGQSVPGSGERVVPTLLRGVLVVGSLFLWFVVYALIFYAGMLAGGAA